MTDDTTPEPAPVAADTATVAADAAPRKARRTINPLVAWPVLTALLLAGAGYGVFALNAWISHWQDESDALEAKAASLGADITAADVALEGLDAEIALYADQQVVAAALRDEVEADALTFVDRTAALRQATQALYDCTVGRQALAEAYYKAGSNNSTNNNRRSELNSQCKAAAAAFDGANR